MNRLKNLVLYDLSNVHSQNIFELKYILHSVQNYWLQH